MAELMWGRVRLSLEGFQGASFLTHALERAASRSDLLPDRYDAAEQLGTWAMQGHSYIVARSAWRLAADAARGAQYDAEFARGRALAYEGMAIALQSMSRDIFMTPTDAREARDVFAEAHRIMRPFAVLGSSDAGVTAPQRAYAEILAWDSVVRAKMVGDDASRREAEAALEANPTVVDGAPACTIRRRESNGDDGLAYPDRAGREGQIGAVVMRMRFDASGAYQDAVLAASVGHEDLERSVVAAAGNWTYITDVNADCRVQRVVFMPVTFWMRQW
jgi:TonB family protein